MYINKYSKMPDFRKDIDGSAQHFYLKYQVDHWATVEKIVYKQKGRVRQMLNVTPYAGIQSYKFVSLSTAIWIDKLHLNFQAYSLLNFKTRLVQARTSMSAALKESEKKRTYSHLDHQPNLTCVLNSIIFANFIISF